MLTESCSSCGAKVYAGQTWCGQCFAPRAAPTPVSTPQEPRVPPSSPLAARMPASEERARVPTYSRWRGGPTSFGPAARFVLSVLAILLGLGFPMSRGLMVASIGFDVPGTGYIFVYTAFAAAAEVYLFSRIWKRERIA